MAFMYSYSVYVRSRVVKRHPGRAASSYTNLVDHLYKYYKYYIYYRQVGLLVNEYQVKWLFQCWRDLGSVNVPIMASERAIYARHVIYI